MPITLPDPKLAQLEIPWIVATMTANGPMSPNAFANRQHAVAFALMVHAKNRTRNAALRTVFGHAVFGWFDAFDPTLSESACANEVLAWAMRFMRDDNHVARFRNTTTHGTFTNHP